MIVQYSCNEELHPVDLIKTSSTRAGSAISRPRSSIGPGSASPQRGGWSTPGGTTTSSNEDICIREDKDGRLTVVGATEVEVASAEDALR
jgi:hypothetical protein